MINWFRKDYWFLSNQYRCEIIYKGISYPSVENAFQAQKYQDDNLKKEIASMNPKEAKKAYRKDPLKFGLSHDELKKWNIVKRDILKELNIIKYTTYPELKEKLLNTNDELIVEGNNWNDDEYGITFLTEKPNCKGKIIKDKDGNYVLSKSYVKGVNNKFGEILMEIRSELK